MSLLAPGRFSTTTLWPSSAASLPATRRVPTSVELPGGKPTRTRMGWEGYLSCAPAAAGTHADAATQNAASHVR